MSALYRPRIGERVLCLDIHPADSDGEFSPGDVVVCAASTISGPAFGVPDEWQHLRGNSGELGMYCRVCPCPDRADPAALMAAYALGGVGAAMQLAESYL